MKPLLSIGAAAVTMLLGVVETSAQLGLQDVLRGTPQSTLANPAVLLAERLTVQIASYGTSTQLSFRPRDIGSPDAGALVISPERLSKVLPERVSGRLGLDASTILINVRRDWGQFGFHHGVRGMADVRTPRATLSLIAEGNRVALGRRVEVLPEGYASTWHELGGHYARRLGGGVTLGARVKLLLGSSDLRMVDRAAVVSVAPADFAFTYAIDASGRSAGYGLDFGRDSLEAPRFTLAPGAGIGAALDIGFVRAVGRRLSFGVGLRDLGAISWGGRRHDASGEGVYVGAEGNVFAEDFSLSTLASYDSVRALIGLRSTAERYTAGLPAKLTAHAGYRWTEAWTVGLVGDLRWSARRATANLAASVLYEWTSVLRFGGVLGVGGRGSFAGLSADVRLGPILVYASTEQVLGLLSPYATANTHGRLGVAVVME